MAPSFEELVGTWMLRDFSIRDNGASDWKPWGSQLRGLLIYNQDGYMSASINRNVETQFDPIKDVLFYAGRYSLNGLDIHHEVLVATSPDRINTKMVRSAQLIENELELKGHSESGKEFKLVWTR